jgi:hypothetical protein
MSLIDPTAPTYRRSVPPTGRLRKFGLTIGCAFAVIAAVQGWRHHSWSVTAGIAGVLAVMAVLAPRALAPLSNLWMRLGVALGRVSSFVVLTASYFLVLVPTGMLLKILRLDILKLKRVSGATFWIPVDPTGPSRRSREPY